MRDTNAINNSSLMHLHLSHTYKFNSFSLLKLQKREYNRRSRMFIIRIVSFFLFTFPSIVIQRLQKRYTYIHM